METKSTNLESDFNSSQAIADSNIEPILPRSAWTNQIAYLRLIFRAKKALDRIEKETDLD